MSNITTHEGRTTYLASNEAVQLYATAQGGLVTADFSVGGRKVNPYFIAPWWKEGWVEGFDSGLTNVLRGSFLCMPFGGDADGYLGDAQPVHGWCAHRCWSLEGVSQRGDVTSLHMRFDGENGCGIDKNLILRKDQAIFYEEDILSGYDMKAPIAYHPTVCLPDAEGAAHLIIGGANRLYTATEVFERPENGGYTLFKMNQRLDGPGAVPTNFGATVDLTRQPVPFGYEDVVLFVCDDTREFCFTALTFPEDYIYFQIKNPRVFQSTMLWLCNGGRHYEPWNGRIRSVMGIEECTANLCFGARASVEPNPLSRDGVRTYAALNKEKPTRVSLISGVAQAPKGFTGVKDMVQTADGVEILGLNGERIPIRMDLDFIE